MSGEEYLELARNSHEEWKRKQALDPNLSTRHSRPEREKNTQTERLRSLLALAVCDAKEGSNRFERRNYPDGDKGYYDCDLSIVEPHKLPTVQRFVRLGPYPDNVSPPMLLQMESGEYPTVGGNTTNSVPTYTFTLDAFGHYIYYRVDTERTARNLGRNYQAIATVGSPL